MHEYSTPPPNGRSGPSYGDTVAEGWEFVMDAFLVLIVMFIAIVAAPITVPLWVIGKLKQ